MPRKARIDAPGAQHHIIVRGIERRKIFRDDVDIALSGWSNAWQNYLKFPRRSCCQEANIPKQSKPEALYDYPASIR